MVDLLDQDRRGSAHALRAAGSTSARLTQQTRFGSQSLVLLNVIFLEAHGDPLGHLQVLLQAGLRAAGLEPETVPLAAKPAFIFTGLL